MTRLCSMALVAAGLAVFGPAHAVEVKSGPIAVDGAWARATTAQAQAGGAFMTIANAGPAADQLVAVRTDIADRAEIHLTVESDGVMKMREAEAGVAIPAGQSVEFRPGGYHVMLMGLKRPLTAGESFPLALTFDKAGQVQIQVEVKPANHMPAGAQHGHHGKH